MRTTNQTNHRRTAGTLVGVAVVATLVLLATTALPGVAGAHRVPPPFGGRIKPHQVYSATVNGRSNADGPVVIEMACFGAIRPGQTGHPMRGQTLAVEGPNVVVGTPGNTGANGTEIGAFFGAPPPAIEPGTGATGGPVYFRRYGRQLIPVAEVLPCGGSGQVTFVPLPLQPGAGDVVVPVTYVGQP
jgi:hypothetical protein